MTTFTMRGLIPATMALALMLSGCTDKDTPMSSETLTKHTWSLLAATDAAGNTANALTDGEQAPIELIFQADRLRVANACNNLSGGYQFKDSTLEVGQMIQTMMACEPALMARETAIKTYLEHPLAVQYDANNAQLTLSNESGKMVFQANVSQPQQ